MARFFSNVKLFSTVVADRVSLVVTRKGYAVAAAGGAALGGGRGGAAGQSNMMMILKKEGDESAPKSPWVPDSVTGYYRPENQENQIDAVELRRMLLKSNIRGH
ncbi:protein SENESCENCE-ASSOCIATED GENE 21, mitochondrial-like [Nicotiana tabacum]|uniref:Protein SENESCENCE-ASSOCIATED GENE 21, mitochondrial-like n=1 Tax=Nicotiana tabacum TaxID=4097 RepID=A0A1S4BVG7_TOBAC|nr:PREDICTED: protein SENESCENCE-ASSOCIATED GENE 21, mitochondrial-like [Nicotiana tabacum]